MIGRAIRRSGEVLVITPPGSGVPRNGTGSGICILAGQVWVFRMATRVIFASHYGPITLQRNRLTLSDEDKAKCKTFTNNSKIDSNYKNSKHMLCVFHAIWNSFQENKRTRLPRNSSGNLTAVGRTYGMFSIDNFWIVISYLTWTFLCNRIGCYILNSFMSFMQICMLYHYETKQGHDVSHALFHRFQRSAREQKKYWAMNAFPAASNLRKIKGQRTVSRHL